MALDTPLYQLVATIDGVKRPVFYAKNYNGRYDCPFNLTLVPNERPYTTAASHAPVLEWALTFLPKRFLQEEANDAMILSWDSLAKPLKST